MTVQNVTLCGGCGPRHFCPQIRAFQPGSLQTQPLAARMSLQLKLHGASNTGAQVLAGMWTLDLGLITDPLQAQSSLVVRLRS